jgi:hypothetical protein
LIGLGGVTFAWGDYDNDGFLDLVLAGQYVVNGNVSRLALYHNNHDGTFTVAPNITLQGGQNPGTAWGDFDNDGFLDLAVIGQGDLRIYRNLGGTNFTQVKYIAGIPGGEVAWGDFDNDGRLDLALTGGAIYRNQNGTDFVLADARLAQPPAGSVAWSDFNGDGAPDLVTGSTVYQNGGGGYFNPLFSWTFEDLVARWIDWDNDGWPDFAAGVWHDQGTHLFHNNRAGLFETGPVLPLGQTLIAADLNGDGWSDLLLDNQVFENSGTGQWQVTRTVLPYHQPLSGKPPGAVADYDNDGLLDVVVGGDDAIGNFHTYLYHNDTAATNLPPAAPTGLGAVTGWTAARLTWAAATDDHQSGGLSYNVRVGSFPGGADIVNPMAAADGRRRLPAMGNASENLFFRLTGLEAGKTYYWSVQAIDNGYLGSPFAPEQSFQAVEPPGLGGFYDLLLPEYTLPHGFVFGVNYPGFAADALTVTATSSNQRLLPADGFTFSGTGSRRQLFLYPTPGEFGGTVVTVRLHAPNGDEISTEFRLTVIPYNHPPSFTVGPDQTVLENVWGQFVGNWATAISPGDAGEALQPIWFEVTNDNPGLFSAQPAVSPQGYLTYQPASNAWGKATVTVVLHDAGGLNGGGSDASPPQAFHISVTYVYQPPVPAIAASGLEPFVNRPDHYAITDCSGVARIRLDASGTANPAGSFLRYSWKLDGNSGGEGTNLMTTFPPGAHQVTLGVQDGTGTNETTLALKVVSPPSAIGLLQTYLITYAGAHDVRALNGELVEASQAYGQGGCSDGVSTLLRFQTHVTALFAANDPVTAVLVSSAQAIIDATAGRSFVSAGNLTLQLAPAFTNNPGRLRLRFVATPGTTHAVQVSPDLSHWSVLGTATLQTDGYYQVDDPAGATSDHRYYRLSTTP